MTNLIQFERTALYDEVWTDPVTVVAKRYGLSDHALRTICRQLAVPTPSSGYWSRLRLGKLKPERAVLPGFNGRATYEYEATYGAGEKRRAGNAESRRVREEESAPGNRIVPRKDGPFKDSFVLAVSKYLDAAAKYLEFRKKPGWRPTVSNPWMHVHMTHSGCIDPEQEYLRIIVTPPLQRRALYVADAFMCAIRERGFSVTMEEKGVVIACRDVSMRFRLTELERKDGTTNDAPWGALGRLRLSLRRNAHHRDIPDGISISDEPDSPIEEQLNDLIARLRVLVLGADSREEQRRLDAIKSEALRVKLEAEACERARQAEEAKREAARVNAFFSEADQWSAIERRRQYLARVELEARERGVDLSSGTSLHSWLSWARASCDALDPIFSRVSGGANKEA
ncbi:hypothetical protein [Burkholderia ubonensis]|uniref:hypothetical protein n=1 Tax=Burkholderia ubonensis TaxID=101571 RepID=UPI000A6AFC9D|nr:hypothetical protein [Burkholderia ubonensis]